MKFDNVTILVVGDLMLDEYVVGEHYKMSSEAPVPVLRVDSFEVCLGGAANVACNLRALGCNVLLCGVVSHVNLSSDEDGRLGQGYSAKRFMDLIRKEDISSNLIVEENCRTTTKTRIVINGQQVARYDYEQDDLSNSIKNKICEALQRIKLDINLIIVSDYNKGVISNRSMNILRNMNIPVIVDPKPANKMLYHDLFCLTPNLAEFSEMVGNIDRQKLALMSRNFIEKFSLKSLAIKLGMEGVFYCDSKTAKFVSGCKKEVINAVGAGDTFVSIFGASIALGMNPLDAVCLGNHGAGIAVSRKYTSVCTAEDLSYALRNKT